LLRPLKLEEGLAEKVRVAGKGACQEEAGYLRFKGFIRFFEFFIFKFFLIFLVFYFINN
jgi:hypothetical protein